MTLEAAIARVGGAGRQRDRLGARSRASCPTAPTGALRRSALASSFLAALELARQGRVELRQAAPFAPLYLRARGVTPPDDLVRAVEAVLFAAAEPLTIDAIRAHVGRRATSARARRVCASDYAGRGIELVRRGERWHFQTAADLAHLLRRDREEPRKLSRAGSRRWRSSPITSPSPAPRSRRSAACRSRRARSTC